MSEISPETIKEVPIEERPKRGGRRVALILVFVLIPIIVGGLALIHVQREGEVVEVEDTIEAYLDALNSYDVDAAWALMSPRVKEYVGREAFESIVEDFEQRGWQAEIKRITDRSFLGKEIKRTYKFTLTAEIREAEGAYTETWSFFLVRVDPGVKWNPLNRGIWRIDDWQIEPA